MMTFNGVKNTIFLLEEQCRTQVVIEESKRGRWNTYMHLSLVCFCLTPLSQTYHIHLSSIAVWKGKDEKEAVEWKKNDQQIKPFSSIYIDKIKGGICCSSFIYRLVLFCKLSTIYVQIILDYHLVYWIHNSTIMLEIIGFVLLLNALRRPIPPQTTDIRSNIA